MRFSWINRCYFLYKWTLLPEKQSTFYFTAVSPSGSRRQKKWPQSTKTRSLNVFARPQSSTVRRWLWGGTASSTLCGKHSEFFTVLPQQDQCNFPGCPLWPWPHPRKPPERQRQRSSADVCLRPAERGLFRPTWHGSWAATASLFGPSAGAEAAAVKCSTVAPRLPGHGQRKRRPLRVGERPHSTDRSGGRCGHL